MAKNQVVSIDIGTNAIKFVQLEQTTSGLRLVSAGIELYPRESATEEIDNQTICQTLQKLWKQVQGRKNSVVLSIPRSLVTSRRLTNLPPVATDEQLASLVVVQAETELPFRTDSAVYDYHDVRRTDKGVSVELVAARRETVQESLDYFKPLGIMPNAVIPSTLATSVLAGIEVRGNNSSEMSPLSETKNQTTLVVDIGAGRTDLCLMQGKVLQFSRSFPVGGNQLTQRYQDEFGGNFEVAEGQKIARVGTASESIGDEGCHIPAPADEWASRLVSELKRSISAAKRELNFDSEGVQAASPTNGFVGEIWLCGGGARVAGLGPYISEQLQIPVRHWNPFDAFKKVWDETGRAAQSIADFSDTFAVAFGLGVNAFTHQVTLDLLPKEEKAKLTQAEQRRKMLFAGVAAAMLLVGLGVGGLTLSKTYQAKIDAVDAQLESIGQAAAQAQVTLVESLAIANLTAPRISPLDILREFSIHFGDRTQIAWTSLTISRLDELDQAKITFNIEAQSHQEISKMVSIMAQSGLFANIKSGQVTSTGGERDKKLVFQTQVTCNLSPHAVQMFARAHNLKPSSKAGAEKEEISRNQKLKLEKEGRAQSGREWDEAGGAGTRFVPSRPAGMNQREYIGSNPNKERISEIGSSVEKGEMPAENVRSQGDGFDAEFHRASDEEAVNSAPVEKVEVDKKSDEKAVAGESAETDTLEDK